MSNSATYGFNGNPTSTRGMTGGDSYTIPAGKYAQVSAWAIAGGYVSATDSLSNTYTVLGSSYGTWNAINVQSNLYLIGSAPNNLSTAVSAANGGAPVFGSSTAQNYGSNSGTYWVPAGATISVTNSTGSAGAFVQVFDA